MKLAIIPFSMDIVQHQRGGIPRDLFADMIRALPADAKITGFRENLDRRTHNIYVVSSRFKTIYEGDRIPEIIAFFSKENDVVRFNGMDASQTLDPKAPCHHDMLDYVGLTQKYRYCRHCDHKET